MVGLSVETFRHWKRVLPPFGNRPGRAPLFSFGDLLAASILRRITDHGGVRVGHLTKISKEIVALCNSVSWAALEDKILALDLVNGSCRIMTDPRELETANLAILCTLQPIMTELRGALLRMQPSVRESHPLFPPTEVANDSRIRGSGV
jgi:hypothetical protein